MGCFDKSWYTCSQIHYDCSLYENTLKTPESFDLWAKKGPDTFLERTRLLNRILHSHLQQGGRVLVGNQEYCWSVWDGQPLGEFLAMDTEDKVLLFHLHLLDLILLPGGE